MFEISESKVIKISKGDSAIFRLTIDKPLQDDLDTVYLTVRCDCSDPEPMLKLQVNKFMDEGKTIVFNFTSDITNIPADTYLYDIQINFSDGRKHTLMYPTKFKVIDDVTHA